MSDTSYPEQKLLFFVEDEITDALLAAVPAAIASLAAQRAWTVGPPQLVDATDSTSATRPGDLPVRTFGGVLRLYAPKDSRGKPLPRDLDRQLLADVRYLMGALEKLSKEQRCEFGIELNREYIGHVKNGRMDRNLRSGLIEEWEKVLGGP